MENNIISKRVEIVRQKMRELGAAALVVPTSDPHDSEYIAERWKCREWLTGFTGSAGLAVLTLLFLRPAVSVCSLHFIFPILSYYKLTFY